MPSRPTRSSLLLDQLAPQQVHQVLRQRLPNPQESVRLWRLADAVAQLHVDLCVKGLPLSQADGVDLSFKYLSLSQAHGVDSSVKD